MQSFETQTKQSVNACDINPEHHLLCVGTHEGTIEAWDPRDKKRCATLDVAMKIPNLSTFPSISAIKFKNGLQMGVGTQSGHVLIYDIRSNQPLTVKDHYNKLKIKRIAFNASNNAVYSMDEAILKIWDENSGKQIAYIESESKFNDMCTIPNTGMMFFAQQTSKMLTYYIPSLGPAPRWCSFLDNLTEEIESEVRAYILCIETILTTIFRISDRAEYIRWLQVCHQTWTGTVGIGSFGRNEFAPSVHARVSSCFRFSRLKSTDLFVLQLFHRHSVVQ